MTIKEFIEKAIEGGWWTAWYNDGALERTKGEVADAGEYARILLDPLAWQAVGKVEGWPIKKVMRYRISDGERYSDKTVAAWEHNMHCMIDALAEGKTIEQFLESL